MTRAEQIAHALLAEMQAAGAMPVATDILQPAETLLDLYGEDIRARAYVTDDPAVGEMMLRPDFTVPVVQAHMRSGAEPARYCYAGPVFRKQTGARAREYLQVGFELFDRNDAAQADAEVFALFARLLHAHDVRPVTGDIGILKAAVAGLQTTEARKSALMRHIWRPKRFRALLERMAGRGSLAQARAELVNSLRQAPADELIAAAGQLVGMRDAQEIAARVTRLVDDADTAPMSQEQVSALEGLLALSAPATDALAKLRGYDWPSIAPALDRLEARLDALARTGVDPASLPFEASFGRTTMEYYDGFVFGFVGVRVDLPPVATGGRYDALTTVLGQGNAIPAVGGVIRPEILARLEGV